MKRYLRNYRLSSLAFKVWFNRRQRISVRYFKRNKVNAADVKLFEKSNYDNEKEFDFDRIADECDYERSSIDQRIFYEMTGVKLN